MPTFGAMSARVRKILQAWWLLAIMALVVTPRGYLHHCELLHHQAGAKGATLSTHCAICDEVVPSATGATIMGCTVVTSLGCMLAAGASVDPELGHVLSCSDRGPPVRS